MNQHKKNNPYLLYVGNSCPHKNLERLLRAFNVVSKEISDLNLILVGKIDYFYKRTQKQAEKLKLSNKVIFVGELSDEELNKAYQDGLAYVFPSLSEGFGLPGLEAMKQDLPVISSNKEPLPEIYGQAAIYFNPEDIQDMAKKILEVVTNGPLRERLKILGKNQVKKYSWNKCSKQILEIYKQIL
ncbi:MAG: glycosyltransferase family 1 protein [Patescibacteria group bacterium]|nr:glycosyltransferase family 1 protein [Patescibacteria group bacterium]